METVDSIQEKIGTRIRAARKRIGLTMYQLAEEVGASEPTLRRWEHAKTSIPAAQLARIAHAVNQEVQYFFTPEDSIRLPTPESWWEMRKKDGQRLLVINLDEATEEFTHQLERWKELVED